MGFWVWRRGIMRGVRKIMGVRKIVYIIFAVLVVATAAATFIISLSESPAGQVAEPAQEGAAQEKSETEPALVTYVIDGDTIELSGGERVRYIGIDAAEQNEFCYEQAKRRNEELVSGKAVRLEYDEQREDKYGRTLAYVWLGSEMINLQLVKEGYGESYNFPPNMKYAEEFDEAESEAKKAGLGCWGL